MKNNNSISICAVGDICFGDYNMSLGFGVKSLINKMGTSYLFKEVKSELKNADIVFGNLEGVLSNTGLDESLNSMVMRGDPESVRGLFSAGFNVINIANNHIMQHGTNAFFETCHLLEKNSISVVGLKGKDEFHCIPKIIEIKAKKIGFLGYSFEPDKYSNTVLYAEGRRELIFNDIRKLKKTVDYVVVSCHWGIELLQWPSKNTIFLAHNMVDCGADMIIGHHPHVLQGIETYKQAVILYSLGNFIFDLPFPECKRTGIAKVTIRENKINASLIPILINNKYVPIPLIGKHREREITYYQKLSEKIDEVANNDSEEYQLEYYLSFQKLRRKERLIVLWNLIKNLHKVKLKYFIKLVISKIRFYCIK